MITLLAVEQNSLVASETFQITQNSITGIMALANQNDAEFILMYIPQKAELYWNMLNTENKQRIIEN